MAIVSRPDRCPRCHWPVEFGHRDFVRASLSRMTKFQIAVAILAAIALSVLGILFFSNWLGEMIRVYRWPVRKWGLLLVGFVAAWETCLLFGLLVLISLLRSGTRVLRWTCTECSETHPYRLDYLETLKTAMPTSPENPTTTCEPARDLSDIPVGPPIVDPIVYDDDVTLRRRLYVDRRNKSKRRANPSTEHNPDLDFNETQNDDERR